jgi:hypothetical protein
MTCPDACTCWQAAVIAKRLHLEIEASGVPVEAEARDQREKEEQEIVKGLHDESQVLVFRVKIRHSEDSQPCAIFR